MNRIVFVLAGMAVFTACKKQPEAASDPVPIEETVAGVGMIDYTPPQDAYSCRVPADWKGAERKMSSGNDSVTLIGPLADNRLAFIHILQYKKGDAWSDAKKYAESFWEVTPDNKQPVLENTRIGGNHVIRFHFEKPFIKPHARKVEYMDRLDYALISTKDGFFELWHSAPADRYQETLPVFEAVVRSFKPKS